MLWILGKLKDPAKYYQSLTKRPKKTVAAMLAEMPKKDVIDMALQLVDKMEPELLKEKMQKIRRKALDKIGANYKVTLQEAIKANNTLNELSLETSMGVNAVDELPLEEENEGPAEAEPENEGPAPENEGPEPKGDGPEPEKEGPDEGPAAAAMTTPSPVGQDHWIRSRRSSSGYKGVMRCPQSGRWRVKHKGSTIARLDTLDEACEYYYSYNVAHGYIKDFRSI